MTISINNELFVLGDGDRPQNINGNSDRHPKRFGNILQTGESQILGILWGKIPPKKLKFGAGYDKKPLGILSSLIHIDSFFLSYTYTGKI